ncbi:MAG: hypothetical protein ACRYGO_16795 [Janthinobacterium lividum]
MSAGAIQAASMPFPAVPVLAAPGAAGLTGIFRRVGSRRSS